MVGSGKTSCQSFLAVRCFQTSHMFGCLKWNLEVSLITPLGNFECKSLMMADGMRWEFVSFDSLKTARKDPLGTGADVL
jgi:hypothetical protein